MEITSFFPIRTQKLYNLYKQQESAFWTTDEIDFSKDNYEFNKYLNNDERKFIIFILSFFSQSDQLVNKNLDDRFKEDLNEIPTDISLYAKLFYDIQTSIENIHSLTYETSLHVYITNDKELDFYKNGIKNIPCIAKKANWVNKWIEDEKSNYMKRLIAFAIVEGIFFSGSFCAIFWIKETKKGILNGLCSSNEFISRDEGLHCKFAIEMFIMLKKNKDIKQTCSNNEIIEIIKEAVLIEQEFITESLPCKLIGMNAKLMKQYIEYIADYILLSLNMKKYYNTENPFPFMENIGLRSKINFFEKRENNYSKAIAMSDDNSNIELSEDF